MKKSMTFVCLLLLALPLAAAELPSEKVDRREAALAAVAGAAQGAKDVAGYLTIGGDILPFQAWSVGVSVSGAISGGGGSAGKANFQDFAIGFRAASASPKLFVACAQGKHFPEAKIVIVDAKGAAIAEYRLQDVLISSYQSGGSSGSSSDAMTLSYAGIEYILIGL